LQTVAEEYWLCVGVVASNLLENVLTSSCKGIILLFTLLIWCSSGKLHGSFYFCFLILWLLFNPICWQIGFQSCLLFTSSVFNSMIIREWFRRYMSSCFIFCFLIITNDLESYNHVWLFTFCRVLLQLMWVQAA